MSITNSGSKLKYVLEEEETSGYEDFRALASYIPIDSVILSVYSILYTLITFVLLVKV